jgi:hypothetical protein
VRIAGVGADSSWGVFGDSYYGRFGVSRQPVREQPRGQGSRHAYARWGDRFVPAGDGAGEEVAADWPVVAMDQKTGIRSLYGEFFPDFHPNSSYKPTYALSRQFFAEAAPCWLLSES